LGEQPVIVQDDLDNEKFMKLLVALLSAKK